MADLIPIWEAAGRGKYEIVEQKLAAGTDVNEPDTFFGETALHRAAKEGDLKMVQILLSHGARVDTENQYGETPLHFAIRGRNPEVVQAILKHGGDPDFKDHFGRTPAHCARFYPELRDCFA
ncbi:MAG: ankyrin repeat domain-containing protein [Thermoguttaceae bacterium]|nr:ankyrin repeat domain-containing protein [Thermoguttaceae bacterium]MDO4859205.1 ankyrin repeat domain-containing protein [Thermoguttaceae bacterium]